MLKLILAMYVCVHLCFCLLEHACSDEVYGHEKKLSESECNPKH